ncbi:MAG: hypothetical protein IPN68_18615 [Bacteroidetes bacterium]|nr:hypothetical protein [Bacteroidota bacterium]
MNETEIMSRIIKSIAASKGSPNETIKHDELQDIFLRLPAEWARPGFVVQKLSEIVLNTNQRVKLSGMVSPKEFALAFEKYPSFKRARGYEMLLPKDKFVETLDGEILEIPD